METNTSAHFYSPTLSYSHIPEGTFYASRKESIGLDNSEFTVFDVNEIGKSDFFSFLKPPAVVIEALRNTFESSNIDEISFVNSSVEDIESIYNDEAPDENIRVTVPRFLNNVRN